MHHIDHEVLKLKLKYVPFNYPAFDYHGREANRLINERFAREGYPGRDSGYDAIMSDA